MRPVTDALIDSVANCLVCVIIRPLWSIKALIPVLVERIMARSVDIERMTVLEPGDLLTAVRIPADWAGARFYFEKVADRNTWDFALVSIAAAMFVTGNNIDRIRMAAGAVECVPRRLEAVENAVTGQAKDDAVASVAGQTAVRGATTFNFNHFKIPLLENLVTRAIRDA